MDDFLESGTPDLLYKISKHNRNEIQIGDLGVIRANKDLGKNALPAAVCAVVEVIGKPVFAADASVEFYMDAESARKKVWRVPIRIAKNLVDDQLIVQDLPDSDEYRYFRLPLQTSTIPISRKAFEWISSNGGAVEILPHDEKLFAHTADGIVKLESNRNSDPAVRERRSRLIERGPYGKAVKRACGYKCQVCEALGVKSIAFVKKNGLPYAEAHHVFPVSMLLRRSLLPFNIMVLCPNHHREAHYGNFLILENSDTRWKVKLGEQVMYISKPSVVDIQS